MLAAALAALLHLQAVDPLAPAWGGLVQCYAPDVQRKTCRALAAYFRQSDGTIINDAQVILSPANPLIIARLKDPIFVRGEAVCGHTKDDAEAIVSVDVDGRVFDDSNDDSGIRQSLAEIVRDNFDGEEVCTTYEPLDGGRLRPRYIVDGKLFETREELVIWVDPKGGWRVAP